MNNDIPAAKIKMMKGSLRCFIFGLLGLLPIIGPPFAIAALWASDRARAKEKLFWNAARPYRIWVWFARHGGRWFGASLIFF